MHESYRHIIFRFFLASSITEYKRERKLIAALASEITSECRGANVTVVADLCEDQPTDLGLRRMQDRYNDVVRRDDMFLLVAGGLVGKATVEEVGVAAEAISRGAGPRMAVMLIDTRSIANPPRREDAAIPWEEVSRLFSTISQSRVEFFSSDAELRAKVLDAVNACDILPYRLALKQDTVTPC